MDSSSTATITTAIITTPLVFATIIFSTAVRSILIQVIVHLWLSMSAAVVITLIIVSLI